MRQLDRITRISPQQFWRHGYRWGYSDGWHRLPSMLDDQPGDELADVVALGTPANYRECRDQTRR